MNMTEDIPAVWNAKNSTGDFLRLTTFPDDWTSYRKSLRRKLWQLMGVSCDHSLPLDLQVHTTITHENITLKNISYQTRPGVYSTATLYIPQGSGPFPGVINMHGHWHQGRLAARVQSRGFTLAKKGYLVISVDTFGSGERSTVHTQYEYHGRNLGSHIFNLGETLMGCQLVDNMRAVDVLCSLPEVDKNRIGATGASGGGNQTMYLAAMDDRIKAAVPVCSVGSFESYLYEANCCCETLPGGLAVTEMAGILALAAPRAMLICNGLYDSKTFSPQEMLRSYDAALVIYKKLGAWDKFTYRIFHQGHAYSPEAREAMLGFFELHLKGKGHGMPVAEEPFTTLPEEKLLAFAPGKRPANIIPIAEYTRTQGEKLLKALYEKTTFDAALEKKKLADVIKIDNSLKVISCLETAPANSWRKFQLTLSDSKLLPLLVREKDDTLTIFTHIDGKSQIPAAALASAGSAALLDLSHLGELAPEVPERAMPLHQTARRHMWLNETLPGRWAGELCAVSKFLAKKFPGKKIILHGYRETALVSLYASIFCKDVAKVVLEDAPVSYLFCQQADFFGMGLFIPGILKWGDVPLACALSSAEVAWVNPRNQDGSAAEVPTTQIVFFKKNFK